jgi:ABC-type Fe3+-siderophore transport system permease subunit
VRYILTFILILTLAAIACGLAARFISGRKSRLLIYLFAFVGAFLMLWALSGGETIEEILFPKYYERSLIPTLFSGFLSGFLISKAKWSHLWWAPLTALVLAYAACWICNFLWYWIEAFWYDWFY